jgi:hypothetical protein
MRAYKLSAYVRLIVFLIAIAANNCSLVKSQDFLPVGVVSLHIRLIPPKSQCCVPIKIDHRYFILTAAHPGITSESRVGMLLGNDDCAWSQLADLIDESEELTKDAEEFRYAHSESNLCFLPLTAHSPPDQAKRRLWMAMRERAIDITLATVDEVSKTTVAFSSHMDGEDKIKVEANEIELGSKETFDVLPHLKDDPFCHFKINSEIDVSCWGAPCFSQTVANKCEVALNFIGICAGSTESSIDTLKLGTFELENVVLQSHMILRLYREHEAENH